MEGSPCDSQAGGVDIGFDGLPWLAAYTRARHEYMFETFCLERGLRTYLPAHLVKKQWSDRRKVIRVPLFPSYVFVQVPPEDRLRAAAGPGFVRFVHDGAGPCRVDATELRAVASVLASGMECEYCHGLPAAGTEVEIVRGSLRGCRGRLVGRKGEMLVLSVSAINGGVRIQVPNTDWIAVRGLASRRSASIGSRPVPLASFRP